MFQHAIVPLCSVAFGASFECALLCCEQRGAPVTPGLIAAMEEASKALQLFNRCVRGRKCCCCCCCLCVEEGVCADALNAISRGLQSEITAEIERALAAKDQDTLRKCLAVRCQTDEVSIVVAVAVVAPVIGCDAVVSAGGEGVGA